MDLFSVNLVVDTENRSGAKILLAYLNEADCYTKWWLLILLYQMAASYICILNMNSCYKYLNKPQISQCSIK